MVRVKNRYLLINILYPTTSTSAKPNTPNTPAILHIHRPSSPALTPQLLLRAIRDSIAHLFGDYGAGAASSGLSVRYLSAATSTAIVRVARTHYRLVWAALTFVTRLPRPVGDACVVRVVRVSGTIRKAEEEAVRRAREGVLRAKAAVAESEGLVEQAVAVRREGVSLDGEEEVEEVGEVVERGIESDVSDDEGEEDEGG